MNMVKLTMRRYMPSALAKKRDLSIKNTPVKYTAQSIAGSLHAKNLMI